MVKTSFRTCKFVIAGMVASASLCGTAFAQYGTSSSGAAAKPAAEKAPPRQETNAAKHVDDAVAVVRKMQADPKLSQLMRDAKGVFIMPSYVRAAVGVGGSGGSGILLAKRDDGSWSDPAFYHVGGLSVGLQLGAEKGQVAMVLTSPKALDKFMEKNNFSISADAGLTVVNWGLSGTASTGDVVVWSSNKGLFGNVATLAVNDMRFSKPETDAYYGQSASAADIVGGKVKSPRSDALKQALGTTSSPAMGAPPAPPAK